MKKLGMIINAQKPEAVEMSRRLLRWAREAGVPLLLPQHEAAVLSDEGLSDEEWLKAAEVAIVVGGDGTFLRAGRYVLEAGIPLYGVNLGHLGFLASGKPEDAEKDLERIVNGDYALVERFLLRCALFRDGAPVHTIHALNDVVLTKNAIARLLRIEVRFNEKFFGVLPADGVIISSPTGSTAYALSAGGPILPPHMQSMLLVPICAHTLYSRPILAAPEDTITLSLRSGARDVTLTQDGQLAYEVLTGDSLNISLSKDRRIRTISMPGRTFLDLVQEKLGWGQSRVLTDKE
ncbi:MAG: NAD(+)/NADH kinase [Synergistaceae bacterium]|jgi:NAD+ kinase|nr:NAD(+)/NADH kinase [Synergistaceae bacterium]